MSSSLLIFPQSCWLPPSAPPRVRSLSWLIVCVHCSAVVLPPSQARGLSSASCILATCVQQTLNETIKRLDSRLSPAALKLVRSHRPSTHTHTHTPHSLWSQTPWDIRRDSRLLQPPPLAANTLTSNQWTWIEGCHILAATLFLTAWVKMNSDSVYRLHIKLCHWEKTDYLLVESVIDILWNSFLSRGSLLIQFMVYKYLSNMCLK